MNISKEEIHQLCRKYNIKNYIINNDGSIDVNGSIDFHWLNLGKLPLTFNKVCVSFNCLLNKLTSLEGCPKEVGEHFICSNNQLTSLEGCPNEISGDFYCANNKLISLEGCPKEVGGNFNCSYNQLTSLEGCPKEVSGGFNCSNNKLTSLNGSPKEIGGHFYCYNNPIAEIYKIFDDYNKYKKAIEWKFLNGNKIHLRRFKDALEEQGLLHKLPNKLKNYEYI